MINNNFIDYMLSYQPVKVKLKVLLTILCYCIYAV